MGLAPPSANKDVINTDTKRLWKDKHRLYVRHHCAPSFELREWFNGKWLNLKCARKLRKVREGKNSDESVLRCYDCRFWSGACKLGKKNRIATSDACASFKPHQFAIVMPDGEVVSAPSNNKRR